MENSGGVCQNRQRSAGCLHRRRLNQQGHYGGEAGNFLFAGLHVDTVRIDVWATTPLMWGSQPGPGGTRTIPGWDYVLYE